MNIIHISDLHIGEETEFTHNINTRKNLTHLLSHINKYEFDALVIGGDLAYSEGSEYIYSHIATQLKIIPQRTFMIAGNHDNKQLPIKFLSNRRQLRFI
ncbi:MAG: metallophosphoesterase [Bacteroidales bacterium]|jgi:DNA repair exonuclease SbcCD nuclease subunit|nr:metallophosphoesterase [Bacteroidales bacterium]